jgi:glycosyltransferase involved in cell wall biosynthesis
MVIYNGVDLQRFCPRSASGRLKAELGLPASAQIALSIGQICLRKGQDVLAEAAGLLGRRWPDLHWVMCGERYSTKAESRDYEESIAATFSAQGMTSRLHRLGYRRDMPELMNEADVLVHTARQEPLGRVLLEAAASGLPIVSTDVGGTPEILSDQDSALLVPPDDPLQLAGAIEQALIDPTQAHERAARARRVTEERFSIAQAARNLETFWHSINASSLPSKPGD